MNDVVEAALRGIKLYGMANGSVMGVADSPEAVNAVRDAVKAIDPTYGVSAVPFAYSGGPATHYDMRGFPWDLRELCRKIAHEQAVAKGYRGLPEFSEEQTAA